MALMCAIATLFMFEQIPLLPAAPFLTYDPSFVPAMVVGFAYGAGPGAAVGALAIVIHALITGDWVGALMNLAAALLFILPAAILYKKMHTYKGAIIGLVLGVVLATLGSIVANLTIGVVLVRFRRRDFAAMIPAAGSVQPFEDYFELVLTLAVYKAVSNLPPRRRSVGVFVSE